MEEKRCCQLLNRFMCSRLSCFQGRAHLSTRLAEPSARSSTALQRACHAQQRGTADIGPVLELGCGTIECGRDSPVHAAYGAQIAAPESLLKDPGAHHRAARDDQQQPAGQVGGLRAAPHPTSHVKLAKWEMCWAVRSILSSTSRCMQGAEEGTHRSQHSSHTRMAAKRLNRNRAPYFSPAQHHWEPNNSRCHKSISLMPVDS